MISEVLALVMGIAGIVGFVIGISVFIGGEFWFYKKLWITPLVIFLICFYWLGHGLSAPIQYNIKTYPIVMINGDKQIADVDGQLININETMGAIAKPNQVLEVKTITNHFRGWVYFVEDRPEYKLVDKKEK
jgi:hypothetical protein